MYRFLLGCSLSSLLMLAVSPALLRADDKDKDSESPGRATYGEVEIKGAYPEGAHLPGLFGDLTETLDVAVARIDKAAGDEKVDGLVLRINNPTIGWAKMNAL